MGSNKNNATAKNRTFNFTKATQPLHGAINNATAKNWQKCFNNVPTTNLEIIDDIAVQFINSVEKDDAEKL